MRSVKIFGENSCRKPKILVQKFRSLLTVETETKNGQVSKVFLKFENKYQKYWSKLAEFVAFTIDFQKFQIFLGLTFDGHR